MTRVEYLEDQAARAERLAASALDPLTLDRLRSFAAECRDALSYLRGAGAMPGPVGLPACRNDLCAGGKAR